MPLLRKSHSGLTLIEIVIAMGVLGILAAGSMQVFEFTRRSQKSVYQSDAFQQTFSETRALISNGLGCTMNFSGSGYDEVDSKPVTIYLPNEMGETGEVFLQQGMEKDGLRYTKVMLEPLGELSKTYQLANVVIAAKKTGAKDIGSKTFERKFLLHFFLADDQTTIDRCWGEYSHQSTCLEIGGTFDPMGDQKCDLTPKICKSLGMELAENGKCGMDPTQMNQVMSVFKQMMGGQLGR